jgi:hypothetical protein
MVGHMSLAERVEKAFRLACWKALLGLIGALLEEMPLRTARLLLRDLPAAIRGLASDRRGRTGA